MKLLGLIQVNCLKLSNFVKICKFRTIKACRGTNCTPKNLLLINVSITTLFFLLFVGLVG